jgi:hypothetical protein
VVTGRKRKSSWRRNRLQVALRREVEVTREEARSKGDAEVNDVAATLGPSTGKESEDDLLMAFYFGTHDCCE